jgi:alcohol dehydrogenase
MHRRASFPLSACYIRNLTLHIGRAHARTAIPHVLALMAENKLQPEKVTTNVDSFDNAIAALQDHCSDGAVKTILVA